MAKTKTRSTRRSRKRVSKSTISKIAKMVKKKVSRRGAVDFFTSDKDPAHVDPLLPGELRCGHIKTNMGNGEFVHPINLVGPGTGSWNRTQRSIKFTSVNLTGEVTCRWQNVDNSLNSVATYARHLRVILVHDKEPDGSVPSKDQIFKGTYNTGSETSIWNSKTNLDNVKRFKILKDQAIVINPPMRNVSWDNIAAVSGSDLIVKRHINFYKKLSIKTTYGEETSPPTISDISSGALYLVLITRESAPSPQNAGILSLVSSMRLRFEE